MASEDATQAVPAGPCPGNLRMKARFLCSVLAQVLKNIGLRQTEPTRKIKSGGGAEGLDVQRQREQPSDEEVTTR